MRISIYIVFLCLLLFVKILPYLKNNLFYFLTWVMHHQLAEHGDHRQLQVLCGLPLSEFSE